MRVIKFLIFFLGLTLVITNCKKDHRELSSAVQRDNDELVTLPSQMYPVYAHMVYHDSIPSLNDNVKFLGSNKDGNFGTTTIGLYLNANPTLDHLRFGDSTVVNSAELVFAVNNLNDFPEFPYNGLLDAQLTYSVYPLHTSLVAGQNYFSSRKNLHDASQLIGQITTTVNQNADPNILRLPIDKAYALKMLTDTVALENTEAFLSVYKGYYIVASANGGEGTIFKCDLDDGQSGLVVNYKERLTRKDTTYTFKFTGSKSVKYNTLTFEPGSEIINQLAGDTALGAQKLYLRGMGATKFKVQIPFLKNRSDSFNYAVNRAEVTFYLDPDISLSGYTPPDKISLLPSDSLGREILTVDQRNNTYAVRYDGTAHVNETTNKVDRYVFNLPLHAQQILNGTRKNYGFYLVMADPVPPVTARRDNFFQRIVFGGHARVSPPMLNISYTRVGKN